MNTKFPDMQISEIVSSIPEAMSIYFNQMVYDQKRKGKDITVLSLGEAFFDIPMFSFAKLDFNKGYHYSDSQGLPELREKISQYYKNHYKADIDPKTEIIISAGSKSLIFFAVQSVANPGDEVLIHEPGWLSYQEHVRMVQAVPRFIPYDCEVNRFHTFFTEKTRMLIINNPNNPSGRMYTRAELEDMYGQCRSRGIYLLVDEAYSDFVIEDKFHTMAAVVPDKDGIIVVNSLSKNMGMSGWRVGYLITTPTLISNLLKLNQHIITCAPTVLQHYMAKYFDDLIDVTLPQVRDIVEKRTRIAAYIEELGLKKIEGNSTFYYMLSIEEFPGTSMDFALYLLLYYQICVVPGSAYGKSTTRFVRIGIGAESEERIYDALLVMRDLIHVKIFDRKGVMGKLEQEGLYLFDELQ